MNVDERCKAIPYRGEIFNNTPCLRRAVENGYCRQHNPDAVTARQKKREREWSKKWREQEKQRTRQYEIDAIKTALYDAACARFPDVPKKAVDLIMRGEVK